MSFRQRKVPDRMEGNIVFYREGHAEAFYGVKTTSYPPLSVEQKKQKWVQDTHLFQLLQQEGLEARHYRIRRRVDWNAELRRVTNAAPDEASRKAAGEIASLWNIWIPEVVSQINFSIFAVQLPMGKGKIPKHPIQQSHRFFMEGIGSGTTMVLDDEIQEAQLAEAQIRLRLGHQAHRIVPLSAREIADYVYRHHYWRGTDLPALPPQIKKLWPRGRRSFTWLCEGQVKEYANCVRVRQRNHDRFVSFVCVSGLPDEATIPGEEVMFQLPLQCGYNVDALYHYRHFSPEATAAFAKDKKEDVDDTISHIQEINRQPSQELIEKKGMADAFSEYVRKNDVPMLYSHMVFCVEGRTQDEVDNNADDLIRKLKDYGLVGFQPSDVQKQLFESWLPGGWDDAIGYDEPFLPEVAAAYCSPGSMDILGDEQGFPIALTLMGALVQWDPTRGPQINKDASMAIVGPLGSGKSFLLNMLIYYAVLIWGARVFAVDVKIERSHWSGSLPGLEDKVYPLVLDGRKRPGVMDPFRLMEDKDAAREVVVSMISRLRKKDLDDGEEGVLMSVARLTVEEARAAGEQPSMRKMLLLLKEMADSGGDEARRRFAGAEEEERRFAGKLYRMLYEVADLPHGKLLFGDPEAESDAIQDEIFSDHKLPERGIILLQMAGLKLPDPRKPKENMALDERVSLAVMMSTALLAEQFLLVGKQGFRVAALDEAWAWLRSSQGAELAEKLQRAGRSANAGVWYATQKSTDVQEMIELLSTYVCMGCNSEEETEAAIAALGMPPTKENKDRLRKMYGGIRTDEQSRDFEFTTTEDTVKPSHGFMKDLEGRVGECTFHMPDDRLSAIFNTKPEAVAASKASGAW